MAVTKTSKRPLLLLAIVTLCLAVIVGISIAVWKIETSDGHGTSSSSSFVQSVSYAIGPDHVTLTMRATSSKEEDTPSSNLSLTISLAVGSSTEALKAKDVWSSQGLVAMEWSDGRTVSIRKSRDDNALSCLTVNWTTPEADKEKETTVDCIDISESFWFGGFEESYQHWPINELSIPMAPFVTGDAYSQREIGDVIEPLLVSSLGIGIYVEENVPLYISFNHQKAGHLCLKGKTGTGSRSANLSSITKPRAFLVYHVCRSKDITRLWKEMARAFIPKPRDIPSPALFRYPIWSTWARYKGLINQTTALEYADDILNHGFGISQLEIDDNWTPKYGDFTFDLKKFPDAKAMVSMLTFKAIPVTVWMHPFFNNDSKAFQELSQAGYLVKEGADDEPALTKWWRGNHAGILDVTNQKAVRWYLDACASLRSRFDVASFKFDAGEVNWLPLSYTVKNPMASPNDYSRLFAKMAYLADTENRRQETRVGFKTQHLPILVRMIDRDSIWSHERGLKSLIPTALTFSVMGYHFILPDMIGGNAYDPDDLDKTVLPDAELFVRWLQVSTFMPTLQFSVAPWSYNDDAIVNISRKFVLLHEQFAETIVTLAREAVTSGDPIIRPLWWIAPNDRECWVLDSEFLLGDQVLVAPVLERGAVSRDVYLPKGVWKDGVTRLVYAGPLWLRDYPAPLEVLPYFLAL